MNRVREKVDQDLKRIGVEIIDVRLKRVDLPQEVSESVYRRMEAERKRMANEQRSTGAAEAEKIRADADRSARCSSPRPIATRSACAARATRGGRDLRGGLPAERRVLRVLPQHGGVPLDLPRAQRPDAARGRLGLLRYLRDSGRGK
jgi:regulator of protease activity HflC (stomatin/prohibitin superfamily)